MGIKSFCVELSKKNNSTLQEIETSLNKLNPNIIRWAITNSINDTITVSYSCEVQD